MNPDQNERQVQGAEGGADEDEFGEFEGFEGAEGVPALAQAAPSPWATFPDILSLDLLPVQTSPATPAEEAQACGGLPGNDNWTHRAHSEPPIQPQQRMLNPPDVSLSSRQPDAIPRGEAQAQQLPDRQRQMQGSHSQVTDLERQLAQTRRQCNHLSAQLNELRAGQERRQPNNSQELLEGLVNNVQELTNECRQLRTNNERLTLQIESLVQGPELTQRITTAVSQALENARPFLLQQEGAAAVSSQSVAQASGDVSPQVHELIKRELQRHASEQRRIASQDRRELLETLSRALQQSCKLPEETNGETS